MLEFIVGVKFLFFIYLFPPPSFYAICNGTERISFCSSWTLKAFAGLAMLKALLPFDIINKLLSLVSLFALWMRSQGCEFLVFNRIRSGKKSLKMFILTTFLLTYLPSGEKKKFAIWCWNHLKQIMANKWQNLAKIKDYKARKSKKTM